MADNIGEYGIIPRGLWLSRILQHTTQVIMTDYRGDYDTAQGIMADYSGDYDYLGDYDILFSGLWQTTQELSQIIHHSMSVLYLGDFPLWFLPPYSHNILADFMGESYHHNLGEFLTTFPWYTQKIPLENHTIKLSPVKSEAPELEYSPGDSH